MSRSTWIGLLLLLGLSLGPITAQHFGYGQGAQDWDFVEVRPGAQLFYWLHYTLANVDSYYERPLVIWLQGGPGSSSTGMGNFQLLGPLYMNGSRRTHSWVNDHNVLFIDSPVGTGYSFVERPELCAKNNLDIAKDLVTLMVQFYAKHREFEPVPLHIFGESYAGKMAPEFALELYRAVERGELRANLKSVAVGNPYTSPIHSVRSYGPYLYQMGLVDGNDLKELTAATDLYAANVDAEQWAAANKQFTEVLRVVSQITNGTFIYNVERPTYPLNNTDFDQIELTNLMRDVVPKRLNLTIKHSWSSQYDLVRENVLDKQKSSLPIIVTLLNETPLHIGVYSGVLDLICATPGTVQWVDVAIANWKERDTFEKAERRSFLVDGILEGYERRSERFGLFWVQRSGHMVPKDNPQAMNYILKQFTSFG